MGNRLTMLCVAAGVWTSSIISAPLFVDSFDRPDGIVGNEWNTWYGTSIGSPEILIKEGQLLTLGTTNWAGGIFRTLETPLPLTFSFDFRTDATAPSSCSGPSNDGGWLISFNSAATSSVPVYGAPSQVAFFMYAGSRHVYRWLMTPDGRQVDGQPLNEQEPVPGQRDFKADILAHVEGVINADLSATITVFYNDGLLPDPIVFTFQPPANALNQPYGNTLILSNPDCTQGPHYFDNLVIESVSKPATLQVSIDIKPGDMTNSLNPRSMGKIPVAILGTSTFDVHTIDTSSLFFGACGTESSYSHASIEDVNRDGIADLMCHFNTQSSAIPCSATMAILNGTLTNGTHINGTDGIKTTGCKK